MTTRATTAELPARLQSRSRLAFDSVRGRTRLAVNDLGAPLRVIRGFELDDGRLLVQIISAAPGLFAGDRYELRIEVASGARAVVLTPAATKIHSMPGGGFAEQVIEARVAPAGLLEIYPTLSIPFAQSDFRQRVNVDLAGDARFGWLDPWAFGRTARGERWAFRRLSTRLRIDRDGGPLYRDALELNPGVEDVAGFGLLEHATHSIAGCWFGACEAWPPSGSLDDSLAYGTIPPDGLYVRGLFRDGSRFRAALESLHARAAAAWNVSRIPQTRFTL